MAVAGAPRRLGSSLLWATAAQASSSATNLSLYVGILLTSDTAGLGRWVAVLGVYHLALALSRSLVSEPMVATGRPTDGPGPFSWSWARRRHGALGLGASLGVGVVGWLIGAAPTPVVALALALPALIGQDAVRHLAWARLRPVLAVALDLVWLVVTGSALVVLALGGAVEPDLVVGAWLAGGVLSAVVGGRMVARLVAPAAAMPSPAAAAASGRPAEDQVGEPGPESLRRLHGRRHSHALLVTARNLLPIAVALLIGPVAAGLLKAALLPFTPILTIFAGLRLAVLPAMQRAAEAPPTAPSPSPLDRLLARLLGWYAVTAIGAVVVTAAAVTTLSTRLDGTAPIASDTLRWGAVVAVMTILVRPVAEAVALGRSSVGAFRRRLLEMGAEWGGVFGVALLADQDRVVVGWAIGMAAGGLVWIGAGVGGRPVGAASPTVAVGPARAPG